MPILNLQVLYFVVGIKKKNFTTIQMWIEQFSIGAKMGNFFLLEIWPFWNWPGLFFFTKRENCQLPIGISGTICRNMMGLSTWKHQLLYDNWIWIWIYYSINGYAEYRNMTAYTARVDHWSQAMQSSVSTWMGDSCLSVVQVLLLTLKVS